MPLKRLPALALVALSALLVQACSEDSSNRQSRVVLGTSEEMTELNALQYQLPFVVQVSTNQGDPAPNVTVNLSLKPLTFFKGNYYKVDVDADGSPDQWAVNYTALDCPTEDANANGSLEGGEDQDGDGVLEPRNSATITEHPEPEINSIIAGTSYLVTDTNGFGYFSVTFPKSEAWWVRMSMIAEAADGLPGNTVTHNFVLPVLQEDLTNIDVAPPGGLTESPYGVVGDCTDPL